MTEVKVKDAELRRAAESDDMDAFVKVFVDAINAAIGGQLTADNITDLNTDQLALLGWSYLHEEVMDGGYVQLIYNGYGSFIFRNPLAKVFRSWGMPELYSNVKRCQKYYFKYHEAIERDMSDDDFMALYEQMPEFDTFDDDFVVNEEMWTHQIAEYIDDHIADFATIE